MISDTALFDKKGVKIVLLAMPNERFIQLLTIISCMFISFQKNM